MTENIYTLTRLYILNNSLTQPLQENYMYNNKSSALSKDKIFGAKNYTNINFILNNIKLFEKIIITNLLHLYFSAVREVEVQK